MNMLRISKRLVLLVVTILFFSVSISAGNAESPITITPNIDITQGMTDDEYIFTVTSGKGISPYAQYAYSIYVQNDPLHPDELKELIASELNDNYESTRTFTISYTFSQKGTYVLIVTFVEPFSSKSTEERLIIHITNGEADCSNGHTWSTPAYTWAADSLQVTAERVCGECGVQESETVNATSAITTPAACTSQGVLTYTSAAFQNEAFEIQTKTAPIEATGHSPVIDVAVTPTCTETGLTEGSHCSVCAAILKTQQVVPTTAHTLISHAALEPTCTSAGNKAYWECGACGGHFKDLNGQEAYSEGEWILPMDPGAHAWSTPAYEWTDDNLSVKATRICTHDASHKETETVDSTPSVTKPATCEGKGETTYTASFTNTAFESQTKTVENINALGHAYGNPAYTWAVDYSEVTATRTCAHDASHKETETVSATGTETVAASCETDGTMTYSSAVFQNSAFAIQTKTIPIPRLGHTFSAPTYTWAQDYSTVTASRTCTRHCGHAESETVPTISAVTRAAACEAMGETTYTATFTNGAFETQTKTVENIAALGHHPAAHPAQTASCTAEGNSAYWSCGSCGLFFSDEQCTKAIAKDSWIIPQTAHLLTAHDEAPADCTAAGNKAYWECSACGGHFKDPNGQEAYSEDEWILPIDPSAHAWSAPAYEWTDDNLSVKATRICTHDANHMETETVGSTSSVTKTATCEGKGETTYTASFANTAFESQTKTVENINALGHAYGDPAYSWAEDYSEVTATRTCAHDASHKETETVSATGTETIAAACETDGTMTYSSAVFQNSAFAIQTKTVPIPRLGHTFSAPTYTCAQDYSTVTASRTCTRHCGHAESETVPTISAVTRAAACEAMGETTYTATFTNGAFETQTKTVENIAALGHDYGEPTYTWEADFSKVTAARTCTHDANHKETETVHTTSSVTKPTTCEGKGETTYTASFTNPAFESQTKTIENINALGHDYSEPTYTWAKDYSSVTATRICAHDASHIETETAIATSTETVAVTCETNGLMTYTAAFTNTAFAVQTKNVTLKALGHHPVSHPAQAASCTAEGNSAYWSCGSCGLFFSDEQCTKAIAKDSWIIPQTTHLLTAHDEIPADCTTAGNMAYWECSACGGHFKDPNGQEAYSEGEWILPIDPSAHAWSAPAYEWADDNLSVKATRICTHDANHMETETVNSSPSVTKPATCEGKGETTYTASFTNTAFESQTKTVENINALGHDYGNPAYTWAVDYSEVTATRTCAHDASHKETETVSATGTETVAATCEMDGTMTYSSAVFQNSAFAIQTKTVPIPRLGHTFSTPVYTWAQDYSTVTASRTCMRNCGHAESETVPTISAVTRAAACEAMGETTYTATFTNGAFETQTKTVENIAALGHDYGEPTYSWTLDYSTVTASRTCTRHSGHTESETVPTISAVTRAATCEGKGETTFTATFTNPAFESQIKTVENINPLGHDYSEPTYTWAKDYSTVTVTRICAHDASHIETETAIATGTETIPAACETNGLMTYTAAFANTAFAVQTKTVTLKALGHHPVSHPAQTASCTAEGNSAYWSCGNCGLFFSDEQCTKPIAKDSWIIPQTAHLLTAHDEAPADCTAAGNKAYWECSACGGHFKDPNGQEAYPDGGWVLPMDPNAHTWGTPAYEWADDNLSVKATRTCTHNAEHKESETVDSTSSVSKPATCEGKGETTFTATFTNGAFETQTKAVENINPLGHNYGEPTYTWEADFSKVTAARTCTHDANHMETETADSASSVTKAATCEGKGETTFTAAFTNPAFETQTQTVENIDALDHAYGTPTYTWEADFSKVTATRTCTHDANHKETETVHTTPSVTKPATCEGKGETTYTASFTNPAFESQTKTVENINALGHNYGEPTYIWAKDYSSVIAARICTHDANHMETETVLSTSSVTKPATCEGKGETTYTVSFTNGAFEAQTRTVENINALGHDYGEPTYSWALDYSTVTASRTCTRNAEHVEAETVPTISAVTRAATCEGKGETTFTAAFTNPAFETQTQTVDNIDALDHAYGTPTYTWEADFSKVTATRICAHDANHKETETVDSASSVTKPATCEGKGETTYTASFTNPAFESQTKSVENINPLGHDYSEPTYTWAKDYSSVTATRTCTHDANHKETETVSTTPSVTKPATCEGKGETTYTISFANPAFESQSKTVENINALGHDYGEPTYSWAKDLSSVTAARTCTHDANHMETETVDSTSSVTKPATCEGKGETTFTAVFTNPAFVTQTKAVENIDALGHRYGTPTYTWEADNSLVTATRTCAHDTNHKETETVDSISSVTKPATCEGKGETTYTASFTNPAFESQAKTIENINALGHDYSEPSYTWAPDYSTVTALRTCTRHSGHAESEIVSTISAVTKAATCEGKGKTTYTASFTNTAFESQTKTVENINALGHAYGTPTYTWAEDYSSVTAARICAHDANHMETETVHTASSVTKPATCEGKGETTYTVSFANPAFESQTKTVENIDALGHDYGTPTYTWETDHSSVTATRICTRNASHIETETALATSAETVAAACETDGSMTYSSAVFQNSAFAIQTKTVPISRLGHAFSTPIYTWAPDYSTVTASRTCTRNSEHVEAETVSTIPAVAKAATCEGKGKTAYTASFTNTAFESQTKTVENIDALGHDYGKPSYTWAKDYSEVTATRTCAHDANHMETETVHSTSSVTKPATCEGKGETTFTAAFTNTAFGSQTQTVQNIDALGHVYGEPTYTWAGDHSKVTAARTCARDTSHIETETVTTTGAETVPASCETDGTMTYSCAFFQNSAFAIQTKTVPIPRLGHTFSTPVYTWAPDYSTVTASRTCTRHSGHVEAETVSTISAITKAATCEEPGKTTYTAAFENDAFETQTKTLTNLSALSHDWNAPTYEWAADLKSVTATRTCARDTSHIETETVSVTGSETVPATCEMDGTITYSSAVFRNPAFAIQTKTVPIPRLGHTFSTPVYTWAPDYNTVTASRTCTRNSGHVEAETVTTIASVTMGTFCEEPGKTTYTATFENDAFETQTKTLTNLSALSHDWNAPTYEWAADLKSVTATRTCARDASHIETETVSVIGSETVPAICEMDGTITYSSAVFHNSAFAIQTKTVPIPRLGHTFSAPAYTWAPDCSSVTASRNCIRHCGQAEAETVSTIPAVTQAAACEEPGKTTYTAAFENDAFETQTKTLTNIPALSHDWNGPTYEWAADLSSVTATRTCKNGDHPQTETAMTTAAVALAATCEVKGKTSYTVSFRNPAFAAEPVTVENLPALGHAWGTPVYEWSTDLSTVKATRTCSRHPEHVETETVHTTPTVTLAAACEAPGETTYTAAFTNSAFETQTKAVTNLSALSHDWNAPTYEWAADLSSVTATRTCKNGDHSQTETVSITASVTQESTCTATGKMTYTSAGFHNPAFTVQTKEADIPMLSHLYGEPAYTWAPDYSTVTASRTCTYHCGHAESETVPTASAVTQAAACEVPGKTTYTATFTNSAFAPQTKTVANLSALSHDWNAPTYEWATDYKSVTATWTCKNGDHPQTETAMTTAAVALAAACEAKGQTTYTATFQKPVFTVESKTVEDLPALGHAWETPVYEWAKDFSAVKATSLCSHNHNHLLEENGAITVTTVAPTCETAGKKVYTAAFTRTPFVSQTREGAGDAALGHSWGVAAYTWSADLSSVTASHACQRSSDHTESETVNTSSSVEIAPGCETPGRITYTAVFTKAGFSIQAKQAETDPKGHRPVKDPAVAPTYTEEGRTEGSHCGDCGNILVEQKVLPKLVAEIPETPETPQTPDTPDTPVTPDTPETPTSEPDTPVSEPDLPAAEPDTPEAKIRAFVSRCYQLILNREADEGGLTGWSDALIGKTATAAQIIDGFVRSDEFTNRNLPDSDKVDILYRTMLNREADAGGKAGWVDALSKGYTLQNIIDGFCGSDEFKTLSQEYGIEPGSVGAAAPTDTSTPRGKIEAFVKRCYQLILNRQADDGGLKGWSDALESKTAAAAQIIDGFVRSPEYINRNLTNDQSVTILYKTMLDREPDEGGKAGWVDALSKGYTLQHIINGFCGSAEFTKICSDYGIQAGSVDVPAKASAALEAQDLPDERIGNAVSADNTGITVVNGYEPAEVEAFVKHAYRAALGREADEAGLAGWTDQIVSGAVTPKAFLRTLLFSDEQIARKLNNEQYIDMLYHLYLNRGADEAAAGWIEVLVTAGHDEVIRGFENSAEFRDLCSRYGIIPGSVK